MGQAVELVPHELKIVIIIQNAVVDDTVATMG